MNKFMDLAYIQAVKARDIDEVPIGAVIVKDNKVIAKAYNLKEKTNDPMGHAEILCIKKACKKVGDWYLKDCELYVTLEPCVMCSWCNANPVLFCVPSADYEFAKRQVLHCYTICNCLFVGQWCIFCRAFFGEA